MCFESIAACGSFASWFDSEDGTLQTPARAIRLDFIPHQRTGIGGAQITVNFTVPRSILDGPDTTANGIPYEIIDGISTVFGWIQKRKSM